MQISNGKKRKIHLIAIVNVLCLIAVMFTGCGSSSVVGNYRSVNGGPIESGSVAVNSDYELLWDKDAGSVLFKTMENGNIWSDILYDSYLEGSTSANSNSPICITVANTKTLKFNTVRSYSEIPANGKIICKKIDNGIRVTYFFDTYKLAIPIDYTLREDSLVVSINSAQILEDGTDYKLVSVSLVPFLCNVKNDAENGYLFVPTGSGALMYSAETADGEKTYTGEVYGADAARQVPRSLVDSEDIRLPVFGAAGNGKALLGIIEDGAGAAEINAEAGNDRLGYSNVGVTFYVRGTDTFRYISSGTGNGITTRIHDEISGQTMSVAYYPLYGDEADYNGMAQKYRNYLMEKGAISKSESSSPYSVTFLGGTNITTSVLGIPIQRTRSLTTFSQAESIINSLKDNNGVAPTVRMLGFSDNGLRPGSVAGGKKYLSVYGSKTELASLQQLCEAKNILLFFDSEIVRFSKSGAGFSLSRDSAYTAVNKRIEHYPVTPIRLQDESSSYSIIARDKLADAAQLAVDKAKKYNNTAISFSSLGQVAFSDYSDSQYDTRNGIEEDVTEILSSVKKSGYKTAVASANYYAAAAADVLFDIATDNGGYTAFDESIPFYQMVFHSYKPMYTNAINLTENYKQSVAQAAAFGMGLGYTLTHGYVDESDDLDEYKLYGTVYEDNAELINKTLSEYGYSELYSATADAQIVSYDIVSSAVSKTVYSNGITVYTNHSGASVNSPVGELEAFEFVME